MAEITQSHTLETLLGRLTVEATIEGEGFSKSSLSISCNEINPSLPAGMRVERCRAVLISVKGSVSEFEIRFRAFLDNEVDGGACTGQGLEAREWGDKRGLVVVGTDDAEEISRRMPWQDIAEDATLASYRKNSVEISLVGKPHLDPTTFHMVIAENQSPEISPDSAWFSVDLPHKLVLEAFQKIIPHSIPNNLN